MKEPITLISYSDNTSSNANVEFASSCPLCGIALSPDVLYGALIDYDDESKNKVFLLNYCPKCEECFISRHVYDTEDDGYLFESSAPLTTIRHDFPDTIKKISPDFVSIYNESLQAEAQGMTSICGMGYRKSLEFLVKDYAIHLNTDTPKEIDKIKSMPLSACIQKYVDTPKIKTLATASAWLGNDETHYVRKHKDYGLKQLKTFVSAVSAFIDYNLSCEEAESLLENSK